MMKSGLSKGCWLQRAARPFTATIEAGAAPASGVSTWLLMKPRPAIAQRGLSATSVDAYDTCPMKYKLMQDWHIPGPASASMLYGKIVHDVLRDIHQGILGGRARTGDEALQRFRELIAAAAFDDDYQRALFEQQGTRQLGAYVTALAQRPAPLVLHAEKSFQMKVDGVPIRGRMDRVDGLEGGRVRVIDFKTGSVFDQDKADGSLQLSIYAMAARETLNAEPAELVIHNLEDNSEVLTTRDEEALLQTRAKIAEVAEGIAAERFDPKPGFRCGWCEYRNLCPATEQKLYVIAATAGVS
jgi:RecB family exonuclease